MPLSLLNHSALALFAQRTRIPTSARSIGFCAIWVCISSSSSQKCTAHELGKQEEKHETCPFEIIACISNGGINNLLEPAVVE